MTASYSSPISALPITSTDTYNFKQLGWDNSITLNGYKPVYTFYLPIAKYLNPQKAILHLKLAFSPALTQDSRIDIKFNQTLVQKLALPTTSPASWDIELPLNQLSQDWQTLSFSASFSSSKNLCHEDIWIYILPESSITLTTKELPFTGLLNQLPYPFIYPASPKTLTTLLLLPENPDFHEIFGLLQIALHLGEISGDAKVRLLTGFINKINESNDNIIAVGMADKLLKNNPLELIAMKRNSDITIALNNHFGILLLEPSPFNLLRGLLIFTGNNYSALEKAISAFATPEFKLMASGKIAIINKINQQTAIAPRDELYQTTLKELGYSDQSVSGLGRHKVTYYIPLPNDMIPDRTTIKTFITIPAFPGTPVSQITLLVNGAKQSTFTLNAEHSEWQVYINKTAMKPGVNQLDYLIDLHLQNSGEQCTAVNYDETWATIYNTTQFETAFTGKYVLSTLNQFPVPFETKVQVILPSVVSAEALQEWTNLFFKLGQLIKQRPLKFQLHSASKTTEDFIRTNNVIIIGTAKSNPWVKFALDYMPLQLDNQSRILNQPTQQLQISNNEPTGLLEILPSPWQEGTSVLLITGSNDRGVSQAIQALLNDKTRNSLGGNIALINSDKSVEILNSYDGSYLSLKRRFMNYATNLGKNIFYYVKNHPQIFLYLLALLVPLFIFWHQRKKH